LLQIRVDGAHRDLLAANPRTDSVGAIARRWRFMHPGRLSGIYRDRFGVAPSVTLSTTARHPGSLRVAGLVMCYRCHAGFGGKAPRYPH